MKSRIPRQDLDRLLLYNGLSRKIEVFKPRDPERVSLYVCGITPYDTTHLGHAFTYAVFDILVRYLEFRGLPVKYVMNVTDVDDDILRKAREAGENWKKLGNRWTLHFIEDMQTLNIRPPDIFPRASEVISEILATVKTLLRKGLAYESGGSVYFDLGSWPEYGKLSRLSHEEMLPVANERGNNPDDPNKRQPLHFMLWQAEKPGEPSWSSPWGRGRPGWHIECSTMVSRFLILPVDIHGGGEDLVFPHHESEIAQAEAATGRKPFSRFWLHTAMVRLRGEKMSKSLGNLVLVRDLLKFRTPDALRLYLAGFHYRDSWEHDDRSLEAAEELASRLRRADTALANGRKSSPDPHPWLDRFLEAMGNDLQTPSAVRILGELAGEILEAERKDRKIGKAQEVLRTLGGVLGLRLGRQGPDPRVVRGWSRHSLRFEEERSAVNGGEDL